jgi:DNA polymerase III epsilon subunit-like protein
LTHCAAIVSSRLERSSLSTVPRPARRFTATCANKLDYLCARYRVDRSRRTKHGALLDAELLAAVYVELTTKHLTDALLCISQFEITVLTRVIW